MTGEVLEMNKAIDTDKGRPQLINRDPLGKGWILKMKATGKKNVKLGCPHAKVKIIWRVGTLVVEF